MPNGLKIKVKRLQNNLTQNQLRGILKKDYSLGISPNTLVQIEKGNYENIKFSSLKKIAKALNSSFEELFLSEE